MTSSPTVENHRKLSPNDLLPNPQPTNQRIGLSKKSERMVASGYMRGVSFQFIFLNQLMMKRHGGKERHNMAVKDFFPDKWPDIRFCNKYFHLSKHTHSQTHALTLGLRRGYRS